MICETARRARQQQEQRQVQEQRRQQEAQRAAAALCELLRRAPQEACRCPAV
jgi:hypothetical protein